MKFSKGNQQKVNKEMLPQVVNRIFSICKSDSSFPLREKITGVDQQIFILKEKIRRQNDLFKQSKQLTHDLNERMNILEGRNSNLKERLLESLGSEL
jgi:hypothetical protein